VTQVVAAEQDGLPWADNGEVQSLIPKRDHHPWEEYRDFIRKFPCIICQMQNTAVDDEGFLPELVNVSDPHHLKTWGSGGSDAENLVPLDRRHHSEFHQMGIARFELKYNISLKPIAMKLYQMYLDSILETDRSKVAFAEHQRLITRIDDIQISGLELGKMLLLFRDERVDGNPKWKILGFESFKHYLTAPTGSGGLNMSQRTAYRMIYFAEASQYSLEDARVEILGASKAQTILPMLKGAVTEEERREIIQTADSLSNSDLVSWKNKQLGLPDRKERIEERVTQELQVFVDSVGVEVDANVILRLARQVIEIVNSGGHRNE
jgi:hypothetical protein